MLNDVNFDFSIIFFLEIYEGFVAMEIFANMGIIVYYQSINNQFVISF